MSAAPFHILYLVHDLSDPAVARRAAMLQEGGARVTVAGFRRSAAVPESVAGLPAVDMGRTYNGGFAQRLYAVLREVLRAGKRAALFRQADCILARNLEMLAIGVRGRSLCTPAPALVYESLDIHRLLLKETPAGSALRALEGWLCGRACALITSSPAFIREYVEKRSAMRLPVLLVENRLYPAAALPAAAPARKAQPPWVIGWFGAIRCRRSLEILKTLVRESDGRVRVVIRGRPALDQFADFMAETADTPGLSYEGPYRNPGDLARIYAEVHFTWAIDLFEEGLNSAWLLPNRLYEGGAFASVPIAAQGVETGRYIERLGIGVTLGEPKPETLRRFLAGLTPDAYRALEAAARAVPAATWTADGEACRDLVARLRRFAAAALPGGQAA